MSLNLRMYDITQQLRYMSYSKEEIIQILEKKNVKDWAIMVHDKDVHEDGTPVEPHYHIAVRFENARSSAHIAKWFDVPEQQVQRVQGRWQDILKYLTHENSPKKYQYSEEEVICNFDLATAKETGGGRKEEIINLIANGTIREYNIADKLTPVEYDKYKRNIENAFAYRQKILLGVKDRMLECVFITGTSGSGKTSYAKRMCKRKGYSYFVSSSSNDPFDGYQGEDAIILDDLRGNVFTFADLLKITDNHTSSMVKSRYRNKILECKLLIITSILPIEQFYSTVFESSDEPLIQFERRMQTYVEMDKNSMYIKYFDKENSSYTLIGMYDNPILKLKKDEEETLKRLSIIEDLFGEDLL